MYLLLDSPEQIYDCYGTAGIIFICYNYDLVVRIF